MAAHSTQSVALLRSLTFRISSTPTKQLPHAASQIAGAIWNCRDLLSTPTDAKQNSETSVVVHRFKTQLSTLLQDRSVEGRFAAVVLLKSTIEAGGLEILSKSNAWVKNLLGMLKKPDPPTTRSLIVLTLTRIFMLTWDYSNLVREITTPALTAFVPTCLSNIENKRCSAKELEAVLGAFAVLLPHHPTIFRTNEARLRAYLLSVVSATAGHEVEHLHYSHACCETAARLLTQLHSCAPKQGSNEKWTETLGTVIDAAQLTGNQVFPAIDEDGRSLALSSAEPQSDSSNDKMGLKPWKGVYAGSERLISLLQLVTSHLTTATASTVPVPVGVIVDLSTRIFAITFPRAGNQDFIKFNNQVSKDEREAMFAVLPSIHVAAMKLCEAMTQRFSNELVAWMQSLTEHVLFVFRAERDISEIRIATYDLIAAVITIIGPSSSKAEVADLAMVLESCCEDVLPREQAAPSASTENGGGIKQQLGLAGSKSIMSHPTDNADVRKAAVNLLCTALDRLEATCLPSKLRTQIDRTAVLSRNEDIMFASVLNPDKKANNARVQPSLLPILAREFSNRPQVEALLRPRMPTSRNKAATVRFGEDQILNEVEAEASQDDSQMDDDDVVDVTEQFSADPATTLLNAAQEEQRQASPGVVEVETVESHSSKRLAAEDVDSSAAKRLRPSPVAETLQPESTSTLPAADSSMALGEIATAVAVPGDGEVAVTINTVVDAVSSTANNATSADNVSDIGSDEVIPLTMEPDTDEESDED